MFPSFCWFCGISLGGHPMPNGTPRPLRGRVRNLIQQSEGEIVTDPTPAPPLEGRGVATLRYAQMVSTAQHGIFFLQVSYRQFFRFFGISCGWASEAAWDSPFPIYARLPVAFPLKGRGRGGVCNVLPTSYWHSFYELNTDPPLTHPLRGEGSRCAVTHTNSCKSALSC